jgi:hypothetical protein
MTGPRRRCLDQTWDSPTRLSLAPPAFTCPSAATARFAEMMRARTRGQEAGKLIQIPPPLASFLALASRLTSRSV